MKISPKLAVIIGMVLIAVAGSEIQAQEEDMVDRVYAQVWDRFRTSFTKLTDAFELHCELKGNSFDHDQLEAKLEVCLQPELKTFIKVLMLNDREQSRRVQLALYKIKNRRPFDSADSEILQDGLVKPICQFMPAYVNCLRPHHNFLIEHCTDDLGAQKKTMDYSEQLIKSLCKENAKQLLDFVVSDGMGCSESLLVQGTSCLRKYNVELVRQIDTATDMTTDDFCRNLDLLHECLITSANVCPEKSSQILHSIMGDVDHWVKTSCVDDKKEESASTASAATTLNHSLPTFVFVCLYSILNLMVLTSS